MKAGWKQKVRVFKCDSLRGQNCRIEEEEIQVCPEGRKTCCYFCPKRDSCYATCINVVAFLEDNIGEMEV